MKIFTKVSLAAALVGAMLLPSFAITARAAEPKAGTNGTGYTSAQQVKYVTSGKYIANWGARGEDCSFLSTYAESFYTGSYTYEVLSEKNGGSSQSNAYQSALYSSLKSLMTSKHKHETSYGETKELYRYTDCLKSQYSNISSFYSGKTLSGNWGTGWNREHTWPNSKGLGGDDEDDIMMLRPTWEQENSSRGNTAYGESGSYFNPDCENPPASVKGDCARITLYVYTRWGNTSKMWGTSGVMESMNVLLKWMEEDPVDTWEMGRNDAVQAITGTRNVFVDYPEYAWLLFGKQIPSDMSTPSGIANDGVITPPESSLPDSSDSESEKPSSSIPESSVPDSSVDDGEKPDSSVPDSSVNEGESDCVHEYGRWFVIYRPTEEKDGEQQRFCQKCGYCEVGVIPKLTNSEGNDSANGEASIGSNEVSDNDTMGCAATVCAPFAALALAVVLVIVWRKRKISE